MTQDDHERILRFPSPAPYVQLFEDELKIEQERRISLEQRGLSVISTSGVLATLLLGMAAVGFQGQPRLLSYLPGKIGLVAAVAFFAVAAVLGLGAAFPMAYGEMTSARLDEILQVDWLEDERGIAAAKVAAARNEIIKQARKKNQRKGRLLQGAFTSEVVGVFLLAWSIGAVLLSLP